MRTLTTMIFFCLVFLLPACTISVPDHDAKPTIIDIQPMGTITPEQVNRVYRELAGVYPEVHVLLPINLPAKTYYAPRKRYRADSLIAFLKQHAQTDHVLIGITNQDISHTKGSIPDFGLMGLAYTPGKACIVSTFRLAKNNADEQLCKLALHELGHTQGLPHCPEKHCLMRDAEGKNHFDTLHEYCAACKKKLIAHGWHFPLKTI